MLNDHTDAELVRRELAYEMGEESVDEIAWDAFTDLATEMLVVARLTDMAMGLDGEQDVDGFSLDQAYEWFERGETAGDYARAVIKARSK